MSSGSSTRRIIVRGTALLVVLKLLEQATGFISQTVIASSFGATSRTDAYFVAISVVGLLSMWISLPVEQVIIPMFRHDFARKGERGAWSNASVLLNNLTVVLVVLVLAGWWLAPWLVRLIAAGFDDAGKELATSLTRLVSVAILFIGLSAFLSQLLLSYQRFFLTGVAGIVDNLVFAGAVLVLGSRFGIHSLALALVLGTSTQVLVRLPVLWRHRALYRATVDFRHPGMVEMNRLSVPVVLSAGGMQIEHLTDRLFASLLTAGSVSALSFASLLTEIPNKLLLHPFQKTTFPHFTRLVAERSYTVFSRQLFQYLRLLFFLSVPATVGLMLLSDLIVRSVFQRGAFDETAVLLTRQAVFFYAIGIPAAFLARTLDQTFYSLKETRTPMALSLFRIGAKIILAWTLIPHLAHAGIALAESISHFLRLGAYLWLLPAELDRRDFRSTAFSFGRTLLAAAAMGVVVFFLHRSALPLPEPIQLVALVGLGMGTYFLVSWIVRQSEVEWVGRSLAGLRTRE